MNTTVRRHGKHCFCHECLQDAMNAKDDEIDQLKAQLSVQLAQTQKLEAQLVEALKRMRAMIFYSPMAILTDKDLDAILTDKDLDE